MPTPESPRVVLRSVAVAGGLSDGELARLVRREQLIVLQRGAYLEDRSRRRRPDIAQL